MFSWIKSRFADRLAKKELRRYFRGQAIEKLQEVRNLLNEDFVYDGGKDNRAEAKINTGLTRDRLKKMREYMEYSDASIREILDYVNQFNKIVEDCESRLIETEFFMKELGERYPEILTCTNFKCVPKDLVEPVRHYLSMQNVHGRLKLMKRVFIQAGDAFRKLAIRK